MRGRVQVHNIIQLTFTLGGTLNKSNSTWYYIMYSLTIEHRTDIFRVKNLERSNVLTLLEWNNSQQLNNVMLEANGKVTKTLLPVI